jgi:rod shape-determining protein MreD
MSGLAITLSLLAAWIASSALGQWISVRDVRPDFVLAVVVYASLTRRGRVGVMTGAAGGALVDVLSPAPFGVHAAAGVVVGWAFGNLWRAVYRDRWESQVLSLFAAVLLHDAVVSWVSGVTDTETVLRAVLARSLPSAAYTALLMPPLFAVVARATHMRIRWDSGARTP